MAIATAETVSGTATSASSISAASWTPGANDLILVWVACRSTVTVSSVSGNGITFSKVVEDLESPQGQCTLSLWRGMATSPSAGQITATLSGTANAAVIVAHRITGADTGGTNGSGAIGASAIANTGATDTASPSVNVTTTAANSRVYGGATHRSQTYSVGAGETAITLENIKLYESLENFYLEMVQTLARALVLDPALLVLDEPHDSLLREACPAMPEDRYLAPDIEAAAAKVHGGALSTVFRRLGGGLPPLWIAA